MIITAYICIGAVYRQVHIVGASPYGMKVQLEGPVSVGDPVSITHKPLVPIEGRVAWARGDFARIEFAEPLSTEDVRKWFDGVL
ncbi:hypothetical protein GCM10023232_06880 [Sphingosinicella ginsenosidimutans]|uniref:PilZ domain-containing protein n=1 Tax=Allosphingosinicella ginsenosidimutans TaxID=1176539 RepID=A0A5C6TVL7_9SPHN|nr:hypothetical protein [Sphingosinicella ginsenosidimutans]TXC64523.1 hypothetical protein FRZ32_13185 [Sphingosinicella ginsenosidimutans]